MEIRSVAVLQQDQSGRAEGIKVTDRIDRQRSRQARAGPPDISGAPGNEKQAAKEEILTKIKEISEEGAYSVRFEKDDRLNELIVKVVDRDTDEVIRQIPPEELLDLKKHLEELRGNLTESVK